MANDLRAPDWRRAIENDIVGTGRDPAIQILKIGTAGLFSWHWVSVRSDLLFEPRRPRARSGDIFFNSLNASGRLPLERLLSLGSAMFSASTNRGSCIFPGGLLEAEVSHKRNGGQP
jgi:hypothetical protein